MLFDRINGTWFSHTYLLSVDRRHTVRGRHKYKARRLSLAVDTFPTATARRSASAAGRPPPLIRASAEVGKVNPPDGNARLHAFELVPGMEKNVTKSDYRGDGDRSLLFPYFNIK